MTYALRARQYSFSPHAMTDSLAEWTSADPLRTKYAWSKIWGSGIFSAPRHGYVRGAAHSALSWIDDVDVRRIPGTSAPRGRLYYKVAACALGGLSDVTLNTTPSLCLLFTHSPFSTNICRSCCSIFFFATIQPWEKIQDEAVWKPGTLCGAVVEQWPCVPLLQRQPPQTGRVCPQLSGGACPGQCGGMGGSGRRPTQGEASLRPVRLQFPRHPRRVRRGLCIPGWHCSRWYAARHPIRVIYP